MNELEGFHFKPQWPSGDLWVQLWRSVVIKIGWMRLFSQKWRTCGSQIIDKKIFSTWVQCFSTESCLITLFLSRKSLSQFSKKIMQQDLKKKTSQFLKTQISISSSSVESTTIATFPFKIALSKANVKTIRMGCTKWTCHREHSFATNYFFLKKT